MLSTYRFLYTCLIKYTLYGCLLLIYVQVDAQDLFDESQLHLTVQKTFSFSSEWRLEVGERIQWNPSLEGIRFLDDPINHPALEEWDFIDQELIGVPSVQSSTNNTGGQGDPEEQENNEDEEDEEEDEDDENDEDEDDEDEDDDDDDEQDLSIQDDLAERSPDPINSTYSTLTDQPHEPEPEPENNQDQEEEQRPDQDMDPIWQNVRSYTWIRGIYRLEKGCQIALGYQYTLRYQPNSHRMFADFSWRPEWDGQWDYQLRFRIQRDMSFRDDAWQNRNYTRLRNRLRLRLNRSFRLFAQNEWVYRMNQNRYRFDRTLIASGVTYRLGKFRWDLRALYQYRFHRKRDPAGLRLSVGMRIHL